MAYTTINKHTAFFNTVTYTGNGGTNAITGVGHQPDFTWLKRRDGSGNHNLYDAVRGVTKYLESSASSPEQTQQYGLTAFGTDGFTLGSNANMNGNSDTFVSWNWKAGTTSGLSGGTITPSAYSINATAGFGIYKYTGNGSAGANIAHGLGKVPTMILVKRITASSEWQIYHTSMGNGKWIEFTNGTPQTNTNRWNDTSPTSTLFYLGTDSDVNSSSHTYIAYVFCDVPGYSKMGSYNGNQSTNGTFTYTGFKPAFLFTKKTSGSYNWSANDAVRDPKNPSEKRLYPSDSAAEATSSNYYVDFLSNGFKIRSSHASINDDAEYLYMAFGQTLVGSNNVPCTAR